jgi:hypothetical protein
MLPTEAWLLLAAADALFSGQIVPLAKPLGEVIGEVSPFPGVANTARRRRDRQHRAPVRSAVDRHSKSVFGTVRMTCKVGLDQSGKLGRRLALPLQSNRFDRLRLRNGRRGNVTGRDLAQRKGVTLAAGASFALGSGGWRPNVAAAFPKICCARVIL